MKLKDAIKKERDKVQASADDLRGVVAKMDPQTRSRVEDDVSNIREGVSNIMSMLKQAGDEEVEM